MSSTVLIMRRRKNCADYPYLRGVIIISVAPVNSTSGTARRGRFQRARLAIHLIDDDVYVYVPVVVAMMCHEHSTGYRSRGIGFQVRPFPSNLLADVV